MSIGPIGEFEAANDWLAGQRILITGATGTLGGALAKRAAAAGAELILLGRNRQRLEVLDDELQASGGSQPTLVELDLSSADPAPAAELAEALAGEGLDGLVLGAAHLHGLQQLDHLTPMEFGKTLNTNLLSPFFLLQALVPVLRRSSGGRVIAISDPAGRDGTAYRGGYGISKAALDSMVQILASENEGRLFCARFFPSPMASRIRSAMQLDFKNSAPDPAAAAARALVCLLGISAVNQIDFNNESIIA